ncbi:MAG: formimidoylglutamate deiminase [Nostocoides sp.]
MTTTWFTPHAWLPEGMATNVRITTDGERIVGIATRRQPLPEDVRLAGLVLPGLANGHSHAFHRALRGRTQAGRGSFWTWRESMYAVADRLSPDAYLALARAAYAEMCLAGYTLVGEFHYLHHRPGGGSYADPNAMGAALIQAAGEVGIRLTLLDTLYLAGGLGADGFESMAPTQVRFTDGSVTAWAERIAALGEGGAHWLPAAAVHSVRAVPKENLAEVATALPHLPGPGVLHAHVSEQPMENVAVGMFYGATPVGLLADAGLLGRGFTAVHATHLNDADLALLGDAGATACFCPTTERDLADGIGPARALLDAGARLSLGSDQHAVIDPFEEWRGVEMDERLVSNERGRLSAAELLGAATADGYASLGWTDGGRLAPGALADFVAVRTDSVRTAGCRPEQVPYAATSTDVVDVVVGGRQVVADGRHMIGPVAPLLAEAIDLVRAGR